MPFLLEPVRKTADIDGLVESDHHLKIQEKTSAIEVG